MDHIFFIHCSVEGHLGCIWVLALESNAAPLDFCQSEWMTPQFQPLPCWRTLCTSSVNASPVPLTLSHMAVVNGIPVRLCQQCLRSLVLQKAYILLFQITKRPIISLKTCGFRGVTRKPFSCRVMKRLFYVVSQGFRGFRFSHLSLCSEVSWCPPLPSHVPIAIRSLLIEKST